MSNMGTRKYIPFMVRPPLHEDLEECWTCGAPDGAYVQRTTKDPLRWKLSTRCAWRAEGWGRAHKVSINDDGDCDTCRMAKALKLVAS